MSRHGRLTSAVGGALLAMTVTECHHVTLACALNKEQLGAPVLRCREAQVGSGEASTSRSGVVSAFSLHSHQQS